MEFLNMHGRVKVFSESILHQCCFKEVGLYNCHSIAQRMKDYDDLIASCSKENELEESECENSENRLRHTFNSNATTRIGFWSVKTLNEIKNIEHSEIEMLKFNISILCLSETKKRYDGEELSFTGKTILLNSTEEMGQIKQRMGGVAIMLTKEARANLIDWKPVNNRLMTARFKTSRLRNITIINCYAPSEERNDDEKHLFYQQLNEVYDNSPRQDIKIMLGNFSAIIGCENEGLESVMGKHGLGERNKNGQMLVDFCVAKNLAIGGSLFAHKTIHKMTWFSGDGQLKKYQQDHFMIQQEWRNCLLDVRNRRSADILSNHYLVIAHFELRTATSASNIWKLKLEKKNTEQNDKIYKNPSSRYKFHRWTKSNSNGPLKELSDNVKNVNLNN